MGDYNNSAYVPGSLFDDVTNTLQTGVDPLYDTSFLDSLGDSDYPDMSMDSWAGFDTQLVDPLLNISAATPTPEFSQQFYDDFSTTDVDAPLSCTASPIQGNLTSCASPAGQSGALNASKSGTGSSAPVSARYQPGKSGRAQRAPSAYVQQHEDPVQQYQHLDLNAYQPQIDYSLQDITGNQGVLDFPLIPPLFSTSPVVTAYPTMAQNTSNYAYANPRFQGAFVPLAPQSQQTPSECILCGCQPHRGPCPQPQSQSQMYRQRIQHLEQLLQLQASNSPMVEVSAPPLKRRRQAVDHNDYMNEHPSKVSKNTQNGRRKAGPRKRRGIKSDAQKFYPQSISIPDWEVDGVEFTYQRQGQWEEDFLLSAQDIRTYVENCPRKLTIWLQNTPSQVGHRTVRCDMRCRYSECPVKYGTLRNGWFRVAFDEFPQQTTEGELDPYKMAGSMHLWCFEQCIDPFEMFQRGMLVGDERIFEVEHNAMTLLRSGEKDIFEAAIDPWIESRHKIGVSEIPYAKHEHTLSYALVKHHLERQPGNRQLVRNQRNGVRQKDAQKTQDIHMGRLDFFVERDDACKVKAKLIAEEAKDPYSRHVPQEHKSSTATIKPTRSVPSATVYVPPVSDQEFEEMYAQPADNTIVVAESPSDLFSPKELEVLQVTSNNMVTKRSQGHSPNATCIEIQKGDKPLPDISHHMKGRKSWAQVQPTIALPESQIICSASGNAGDQVQGSSLRRSSRVSGKRTP
ncbi:hypothetical protein FHETE_4900 [Fusarium heterosporum]|uniref:Uncharacterized protein n=1 Tax=Fusarium heterosporum TaxID=42747 RepID=A0A8H5THY1_FUSHE|nr:hypothetical protein FHETE_4900 [Fusarium heterosporum]